MKQYCQECLKKAKDDCDGTQPRPLSDRGRVFEVSGKRHGLNFCRGYEFNPRMMPPIIGNAGTREEWKEKVKKAKAEGKIKKEAEKKRRAAIRAGKKAAEKLQKKIDEAQAATEEIIGAGTETGTGTGTTVEVKSEPKPEPVIHADELPTLDGLEDLLI